MSGPDALEAALRAGRIEPLIVAAEQAQGIAARRFAVDVVARAFTLADPGSADAELRARARALGVEEAAVAAVEEEAPPHAVRVPLVDRARGDAFVRMAWVELDPFGAAEAWSIDAEAAAALAAALARAADIAPPSQERERFRLVPARPQALRGAAIEGQSLAPAALASAVSLWGERPVQRGIAITGALRGNAIARVGSIAAKVRAAIGARCTAIVVPAECESEARAASAGAIEVRGVADVESLLHATLAPERTPIDPERAVREARDAFASGWRGYRWRAIEERLARLSGTLPETRPDLRVEILARWAAARRHLGDPEGSVRLLESAEELARRDFCVVPDGPLALVAQQRAMTELKLFRFGRAARAAARAMAIARRARLRGELIGALGCAGLVALARGRLEAARRAFHEALELTVRHKPDQAARSRTYLLDALGRLGRVEEARAQFEEAMKELEAGDPRARRAKESWLRSGWGGVLVAAGAFEEAIAVLDTPAVHESLYEDPLPGLFARRYLGVALARARSGAAQDRGLHLLASSPWAYGRALAPGLRALAQVNVLVEVETRLATRRFDADAAARARAALDSLPRYGDAERWLGPARRRVELALPGGGPRLARAVRALIARTVGI